jgi:hypothetical protein
VNKTTYNNLWDITKVLLRGKIITTSVFVKRSDRFQINDQTMHLKLLENQEQANPKSRRQKEK